MRCGSHKLKHTVLRGGPVTVQFRQCCYGQVEKTHPGWKQDKPRSQIEKKPSQLDAAYKHKGHLPSSGQKGR